MVRLFGHHFSRWNLCLLAGDVCLYWLAVLLASWLNPKAGPSALQFVTKSLIPLSLMGAVYLLVFYISDLYDFQQDYRRWNNLAKITGAVCVGSLVLIVIFYFPQGVFIGRTQLVLMGGVLIVLMLTWRWLFSGLALPERLSQRFLIVGAGKAGRKLLEILRRNPKSGLVPVGFIDDNPQKNQTVIDGLPVLGNSTQLDTLVKQESVDLVVVAITHEKSQTLINALTKISWNGCRILDLPGFYEYLAGKIPIEHISDLWLYLQSLYARKVYSRRLKPLLDIFLALVGLITTMPLFALIAVLIKLDSRGPVFFRQERLGQEGRVFRIIKFRTMVGDAEKMGPCWAHPHDQRITRVGRFLRRYRLDELPQLVNILKGEMSFIGPRPERPEFIREFQELVPALRPGRRASDPPGCLVQCGYREKIPFYSYRLLVKPGITGWAQVMYPYASSEEQTREKLKYDLYYIKNIGFFLDLIILLKTVRIVLFGRGT